MNAKNIALEYERMGYEKPIPLAPWAKVPKQGFPLIDHYDRIVPIEEDSAWYVDANIGLVTGDLVVVDYDEKAKSREFYKKWKELLKTIVETRRGAHFYFKAPSLHFPSGKFADGDLKASRGFIVAPPSEAFDRESGEWWTYRFVHGHGLTPFDELPVFEHGMIELMYTNGAPKSINGKVAITRGKVQQAANYVMTIDSIQGQHGSNDLVRACAILRDAGMTEAEATVVLIEWNNSGKAVPPWSLKELTRAISRTFAKGVASCPNP